MKYSISYVLAKKFASAGRQYKMMEDDLSSLELLDDGPQITMQDLEQADAELARVQYIGDREKSFPDYKSLMTMLWQDMDSKAIPIAPTFYKVLKELFDKYPAPDAIIDVAAAEVSNG